MVVFQVQDGTDPKPIIAGLIRDGHAFKGDLFVCARRFSDTPDPLFTPYRVSQGERREIPSAPAGAAA